MIWVILGLVFLAVTYWSLKGTVLEGYRGRNKVDEYHVSIGCLLVLGVLYIIPIFGIIFFIVYNVAFLVLATRKPNEWECMVILKLSSKNMLHRVLGAIVHFLNRSI